MGRRPRVVVVTMAALLGAAVLAGTVGPGAAADSSLPPAPAPAVLGPFDDSTAAEPTAAGVTAQIGALVRRGLAHGSAVVVDPRSGTVLLDQAGSTPRTPASVTKLATSAAALDVLGPQTRLATTVKQAGGTLYLVGGGDPTLVRSGGGNPDAGGRPSLHDLARAVAKARAGDSTPVALVYDATAFRGPALAPGWSPSLVTVGEVAPVSALVVDGGRASPTAIARTSDPARAAGEAFAALLRAQGVTVTSVAAGAAPGDAAEVARVESASVADIVEHMLTDSENDYAEALAHLVGGAVLGEPTFAGGAQATTDTLTRLGIDVAGLHLVDGSGLSGQDRIPVRLLSAILVDVVQGTHPKLAAIAPGLPVAGFTGTLADRFTSVATRPGRGVVHAKTGTLTGVTSLAGTVLDDDGRLLVFALIANKVGAIGAERETMDRIASRLATCGCS